MLKLSTKFVFHVHTDNSGYLHIVVTRLADGVIKYFFQAHGNTESMVRFLNTLTDDLFDGHFPKVGKSGAGTDNWDYLKDNPHRAMAEAEAAMLAGPDITHYRLANKV